MYGLVNKGIKQFIVATWGDDAWGRVRNRAGDVDDLFIAMQAYPDEASYSLVGAAVAELGVDGETFLERFGEYWVLYTAAEGYGPLLDASGSDLRTFLANLDNLHARVALAYKELRPPSFELFDIDATSVELHYHSERPGLTPMMIGLIKGLGRRLNQSVEIELIESRQAGAGHDVFRVSWA